MFDSLISMLDKNTMGQIASSLGEPAQSVSQGMESSIATVLSGLTSKANDPNSLRQLLDGASNTFGDVSWPQVAEAASNPNSPLISGGKHLMSSIFGGSDDAVTAAVSRHAGLRPGTASTLLSMAVPLVLSYLARRVRTGGMTISALAGMLQRESSAIRGALPMGLQDALRTGPAVPHASPVVAQVYERERSTSPWLPALCIAALLGGLFWLFSHARTPSTARIDSRTGMASRATLGDFVVRKLPNNVDLNVPENGVEDRLLAYIQNPARRVDTTTWFDFDRLLFITGSPALRPGSQEQLKNIAMILKAYPNVKLRVAGYTDNVGPAEQNLKLSQDRAGVVVAEFVREGVSPDRLVREGYGEQYPVADNTTEAGRAQNRRVSMLVIQK
jgi:outer membrane protein OmpA-like peptidoglycan-associated protein